MANKTINERMGEMEIRMDEIVIPQLKKVVDFVDDNKSGIRTASLLDNKIVTIVIAGIVVAGILLLAKSGGSL